MESGFERLYAVSPTLRHEFVKYTAVTNIMNMHANLVTLDVFIGKTQDVIGLGFSGECARQLSVYKGQSIGRSLRSTDEGLWECIAFAVSAILNDQLSFA